MREPDELSPWFTRALREYAGLLEACIGVREASLFDRPTMLEEENMDWKTGFDCSADVPKVGERITMDS
jgi:hypothetical protein